MSPGRLARPDAVVRHRRSCASSRPAARARRSGCARSASASACRRTAGRTATSSSPAGLGPPHRSRAGRLQRPDPEPRRSRRPVPSATSSPMSSTTGRSSAAVTSSRRSPRAQRSRYRLARPGSRRHAVQRGADRRPRTVATARCVDAHERVERYGCRAQAPPATSPRSSTGPSRSTARSAVPAEIRELAGRPQAASAVVEALTEGLGVRDEVGEGSGRRARPTRNSRRTTSSRPSGEVEAYERGASAVPTCSRRRPRASTRSRRSSRCRAWPSMRWPRVAGRWPSRSRSVPGSATSTS